MSDPETPKLPIQFPKDKIFAARRAGLLEWAINAGRLEVDCTPEVKPPLLEAQLGKHKDDTITINIIEPLYVSAQITPPDSVGHTKLTIRSFTNRVDDNFTFYFDEQGHVVQRSGTREVDGRQQEQSFSLVMASSSALGTVFKTLGKERGKPTTWQDYVGGEWPGKKER